MVDQVSSLKQKGIAAEYLSSSLQTTKEYTVVLERVLGKHTTTTTTTRTKTTKKQQQQQQVSSSSPITLLYITPESIQTDKIRSVLTQLYKERRLALFAIDEAHCLSRYVREAKTHKPNNSKENNEWNLGYT